MNLEALKAPFPEEDIEWRIAQAGKKGNGQIWARCLAYVQARAIMNRLDEVCGPQNWKSTYRFIVGAQGIAAGVICELSIKIGGEWITKEDGAEQTDIESFKGGISSALKRAAVSWGIGRYLYNLEEGFARVVTNGREGKYAKLKDGTEYYWAPPALPSWALPDPKQARGGNIHPDQPGKDDGFRREDMGFGFRFTVQPFLGKAPEDCDIEALRQWVDKVEARVEKTGNKLSPEWQQNIDSAKSYICAFENSPVGESA